tara:strand:- start:215 stop:346 length:132 start_codon:yes stop_codon:yes gene_type:complete
MKIKDFDIVRVYTGLVNIAGEILVNVLLRPEPAAALWGVIIHV